MRKSIQMELLSSCFKHILFSLNLCTFWLRECDIAYNARDIGQKNGRKNVSEEFSETFLGNLNKVTIIPCVSFSVNFISLITFVFLRWRILETIFLLNFLVLKYPTIYLYLFFKRNYPLVTR